MPYEAAFQAQQIAQNNLLKAKNVIGVAVGEKTKQGEQTGQEAVIALVERKVPLSSLNSDDILPRDILGVPVDVIEIGYPRAYTEQLPPPTDKYDPMMGGVSISHYKVSAGTLGAVVIDNETNQPLILSNNHVIANSNDAKIGDPILQPGTVDGGLLSDSIATLHYFEKLLFSKDTTPPTSPAPSKFKWAELIRDGGNIMLKILGVRDQKLVLTEHTSKTSQEALEASYNEIDAALGLLSAPYKHSPEIRHIGRIEGVAESYVGQPVRKTGRTTDYTEGNVTLLNATVKIEYGSNRTALFKNQIIITSTEDMPTFSLGGDSGSLIVERNSQKAVGLLFAGSEKATIANPISKVLNMLNIRF